MDGSAASKLQGLLHHEPHDSSMERIDPAVFSRFKSNLQDRASTRNRRSKLLTVCVHGTRHPGCEQRQQRDEQ